MHQSFLPFLQCPACHSPQLSVHETLHDRDQIWEGSLICTACDQQYTIENGIPLLYVADEEWQIKATEAIGWIELHKMKGIYEADEASIDFEIPYVAEPPWDAIQSSFDLALQKLELTGNERVLDLGAGRTWAAKQFALQGCDVVALDIVPDMNVGLGRAYAMMEEAATSYHLIVGDGDNLPFPPDSFDIVFCCGTLHHAQDVALFLENIRRILRPGGRFCAISEPCIAVWDSEQARLAESAAEELALGINESMPTLPQYLQAVSQYGLKVEQSLPSNLWQGEQTDWLRLAALMGATFPPASLRGAALWIARRLNGARRGILQTPDYEHIQNEAAQAQADILTWCGGALFLIARK